MLKIKRFTFNPFQENTYIIYDEKGSAAIIDPGCYEPEEKKELYDFIIQENLKPELLLNTHCHVDHVLGNERVEQTYSIPFLIHGRTDLPGGDHDLLLEKIKSELFSLPEDTIVYPGHGPETSIEFEKIYNPFVGKNASY